MPGPLQEVRGAGVVGEQPTLAPGESFEYTSGAPLTTPSGFMVGAYQMETADGRAVQCRHSGLLARHSPQSRHGDQLSAHD